MHTDSVFIGSTKHGEHNISLNNLEVPSPVALHKYNSDKKKREVDPIRINIQECEDTFMKVAPGTGYQSTPNTHREGTVDDWRRKHVVGHRGRNTHGSKSTRNPIPSGRLIIPEKTKKSQKTKQFTLNNEIYTPRNKS